MKISTGAEGMKVLQGARNSTNKMVKAKRVDKHQLLIDRVLRAYITLPLPAFDTFESLLKTQLMSYMYAYVIICNIVYFGECT